MLKATYRPGDLIPNPINSPHSPIWRVRRVILEHPEFTEYDVEHVRFPKLTASVVILKHAA